MIERVIILYTHRSRYFTLKYLGDPFLLEFKIECESHGSNLEEPIRLVSTDWEFQNILFVPSVSALKNKLNSRWTLTNLTLIVF